MIVVPRAQPRWLPAALLLALVTIWFAARGIHGIHFLTFGDESGHFLGARAIRAGDKLYRDFIDAHGPLSFMAAQAFGVVFGWKEPLNARWGIVALVGLTAVAVYKSPVFHQVTSRLWGAAFFLGLIAAPWLVQSLDMVNYHILTGLLTTTVLAGLVVPAWLGDPVSRRQSLLCGFCLALLCAAAYSLAPTVVLLVASAGCALWSDTSSTAMRRISVNLSIGFAVGCLVVVTWLLCFGDIVGYFVFHVINNQLNYSRFTDFGWRLAVSSLVPSTKPNELVQSGAAITFFSGLCLLMPPRMALFRAHPLSRLLSLASLATAILMINFRGAFGFQDGGFLVASIAILALALPPALAPHIAPLVSVRSAWIGSFLIGLLLCLSETVDRGAITSPGSARRETFIHWPKASLAVDYHNSIDRRIRSILKPEERLLVLVYNPDFFLPAGFLPLRKFHEYLPWEAEYARHPWFGRTRDLCADIYAHPPPVIVYDAWKVWGIWAPETFMPCIPEILKKEYVADGAPNLYVRQDRMHLVAKPK